MWVYLTEVKAKSKRNDIAHAFSTSFQLKKVSTENCNLNSSVWT